VRAHDRIERRLAAGTLSAAEAREANAWLMSLERALLVEEGIPDRPWFRHLVYAPLPSYEAETLPAIREAIVAQRDASSQIRLLTGKLDDAARAASRVLR
jgi:N-acetylated-alpha-linked acidic dipeptidase